jgi:hypothetical protein
MPLFPPLAKRGYVTPQKDAAIGPRPTGGANQFTAPVVRDRLIYLDVARNLASNNDSLRMRPATPDDYCTIIINAQRSYQLFPAPGERFLNQAINASLVLPGDATNGSTGVVNLRCVDAGTWIASVELIYSSQGIVNLGTLGLNFGAGIGGTSFTVNSSFAIASNSTFADDDGTTNHRYFEISDVSGGSARPLWLTFSAKSASFPGLYAVKDSITASPGGPYLRCVRGDSKDIVLPFLSAPLVVAKTANYTILQRESGTMFTEEGAAGGTQVVFTLPTTTSKNFAAKFCAVRSADFLQIKLPTGHTLHDAGGDTSSGGTFTAGSRYARVEVMPVTSTEWITLNKVGTWTAA